ncbi:MAG: ATP-binding protein [Opitutaceae bacterium]
MSVGSVLIVFSLGTVITLLVEQVRAADAELARDGRLLRAQAAVVDPTRAALGVAGATRPWLQLAVIDAQGGVVGQTDRFPPALLRLEGGVEFWHTHWVNWTLWRTLPVTVGNVTVIMAHSLDAKPDFVDQLFGAYLILLPFAVILVAAASWWLARRALRPVGELADAASAITPEHLGLRLPVPKAGDDLARLAMVLNSAFERLARSFHQARRFAADASHELRTPLTILRGEVEAALREGGLNPSQEKRLVSLLEEVARLDRVTESLLVLAQFDSGNAFLKMDSLDFSELVRDACDDAALLGADKALKIQESIEPAIRLKGDAAHLRRFLLNLFDNAVKFNREGGTIVCSLRREGPKAVLAIGNSGAGISPAQVATLFERFSRTGSATARTERGHGLGLSLCREIARGHGGEIVLAPSSSLDWTEFVIALPL